MNTLELRSFMEPVQFRSAGTGIVAMGYAAKFNVRSQNLGGFVETIDPKAFNKTLVESDVRALLNHDKNYLLGRSTSGTLRMEVDGTGLAYEIDLPNTAVGRDVATLLERGDISGSSFGFKPVDSEWGLTEDDFPERRLLQVSLRDVGPVTFPAYSDSEAALRSLAEVRSLDPAEVLAAAKDNALREVIEAGATVAVEGASGDDLDESRSGEQSATTVIRRSVYVRPA